MKAQRNSSDSETQQLTRIPRLDQRSKIAHEESKTERRNRIRCRAADKEMKKIEGMMNARAARRVLLIYLAEKKIIELVRLLPNYSLKQITPPQAENFIV